MNMLFLLLVNQANSHMGQSHSSCQKITCASECKGHCGWSSIFNMCLHGFHTSPHEMNNGYGCFSTSPTLTLTSSPTSTLTSTLTSTISSSPTSSPTSTLTSTISSSPTSTPTSTLSSTPSLFLTLHTNINISYYDNTNKNSNNINYYIIIPISIIVSIIILFIIMIIYRKRKNKSNTNNLTNITNKNCLDNNDYLEPTPLKRTDYIVNNAYDTIFDEIYENID